MKQATSAILERLKKLIRLHKSASAIGNVGEAEAAMLAINKLLTEYNLSISDVAGSASETEPIKTDIVEGDKIRFATGPEFTFSQNLLQVIAKYNYCRVLFSGLGTMAPTAHIVGSKINVDVCGFLYSFLKNNFTHNADLAAKKHSYEPVRRANYYRDFLLGTVGGIARKFEQERSEQTTAITLYNDKAINKYLEDKNVSSMKTGANRNGRRISADAYFKGERHGRNVQIRRQKNGK